MPGCLPIFLAVASPRSVSDQDLHTQIAAGFEQLVILARVTFGARDTKTSLLGVVVPFGLLDQASDSPGELGPSLSPTG
jgi:hypothetical protein